jgi:hypothetical protein
LSGNPVPISAIAFNPLNGVLFGITNGGATSRLVTISLANAQAASLGTIGFSVPGLAFGPNGTLYGYSKAGITGNPSFPRESLYNINSGGGVPTLIGQSGFANTQGDGLAVNSAGNIFFSGNQSNGQLSLLNSSTGAATTFANLTGGPAIAAPIKGLAFDNNGGLFGIYNGTTTTDLLQIGTAPIGGNVSITDVGVFSPPPPSVMTASAFQPVPEPSSVALLGTVAGALLFRIRLWGKTGNSETH